ncbi:MAG: polyprenyl synthetase family protein [Lachnospiraceae bacterium]|nr:polyprenyl synthetase family protein [Lachnospiraceae bacterium]
MNFKEELQKRTAEAERITMELLPEVSGHAATVMDAMRYSVGAGGKRLRPVMMQAAYELCGGKGTVVEYFMAALEMIHNYSLVHDDLPEMDNDELRRGMPTTHIRYGAGMAVLAGDGLLNYAYETAMKAFAEAKGAEREGCIEALALLAEKAGIYGMVGGQCLDVEAEEKGLNLTQEQILYVYENKTAALLQAALGCGAALAGTDISAKNRADLQKAGYDLGIAFQLQDDILDIESTTEELGKPVGSDERNGKKTYVSYLGMDAAKQEQARLSKEAAALVRALETDGSARAGEAKEFLAELIEHLVERRK